MKVDIAPESEISVSVSLVAHGIKRVRDKAEADVIILDGSGRETGYQKYVSNIYGYEIRSAKRMTGACRALLYSGTLETKLDERPIVPNAAIIAARAFEAAEASA